MEIILMSGVNYGFPTMTAFLRTLLDLLADEGRLAEVGDPQAHPYDAGRK
jgi:hypothetical protein